MKNDMKKTKEPGLIFRVVLCIIVIVFGLFAMKYFMALKKPPHKSRVKEQMLKVQVKKAVPEDVQVMLKGFGAAKPIKTIKISSEVAGRIIFTHDRFEKGAVINKDEVLFKIDASEYEATLNNLTASLEQKRNLLSKRHTEYSADKKRIKTLERSMDLARAEYERVKILLEKNSIGNRTTVDRKEQEYNSAKDRVDQMKRTLALYPAQIKEAKAGIKSVLANVEKAKINLDRCTVKAPFTCRIKQVYMEASEYASRGKQVLTIANDATIEIEVSLDSRQVANWLEFEIRDPGNNLGWFSALRSEKASITWLEAKENVWEGYVDRIIEFDQDSRTVTMAVRYETTDNTCRECLPLLEGMFCAVQIPGKILTGLYRLPRWLVTTDNTIYIANEKRLKTRQVEKVYAHDEDVFLKGNIKEGDMLILTRLLDPPEGAALKIIK
ncbi:MAG: HlyD family efflux transporter periplasmic adaptor subunit [Desulfobacteraceae bacterium]|nr:HlyD family efflux transporter periplasmic adaptor subunit [Desulfobacteraceae bacterium]